MKSINRREFLRLSSIGLITAVSHNCSNQSESMANPIKEKTLPDSSAQVAAFRGHDLSVMTNQALEALGGIEKVVHPGESVFIKPNMVTLPWAYLGHNSFKLGECAKPEVIITVAEQCLKAGASEVIIGDGSQMPRFDWKYATYLDGSTNMVKESERLNSQYKGQIRLSCLEVDTPRWIEVPTEISLKKVAISSLVTEADRIISVPVIKTHMWAKLSLSLKNFIGITPLKRYGWKNEPNYDRVDLHRRDYTPEAMARLYIDITSAIKPDLAVIDGSICVERNGPSVGEGLGVTVDMKDRLGSWLIIASTDLVAADATAARVINHDASYVDQILTLARKKNLGITDQESIDMKGEKLDDLRVDWTPARLAISDYTAYSTRMINIA
jgi:uncharacterized protein (DUF362 family)